MKDLRKQWQKLKWGNLATLEYGKGLRGYQTAKSRYPVYGTNGLIGWHDTPLCKKPGVIIGRKGAYRGVHISKTPFYVEVSPLLWSSEILGYTIPEGGALFHERTCCP